MKKGRGVWGQEWARKTHGPGRELAPKYHLKRGMKGGVWTLNGSGEGVKGSQPDLVDRMPEHASVLDNRGCKGEIGRAAG